MKQAIARHGKTPSRLQRAVLGRIAALAREDGLGEGARLTEFGLARRLAVSRTPVRAALTHLAARGLLRPCAGGGYELAAGAEALATVAPHPEPDGAQRLTLAIARDVRAGLLSGTISEAALMRRYRVGRAVLATALAGLAAAGVIERRPGTGWSILDPRYDAPTRAESYRFRLVVEPAALLEPGYRLDPRWVGGMREEHRAMLAAPWRDELAIALFEMNARFHEGLVAGAGNRFLLAAVQQQNRLRRFSNYDWGYGPARVVQSCTEHLEILDWLEQGEAELASLLLRRHLERAAALVRPLA
ncbi:GntR family transcriptional regulator [Elioraea tepidiphila]|jgi:DNA-binding GntR family transcriptional regulator|uniref:GntR family transcriptional regulator n=1 Tax=Elioraea tepidiphila TaxID=457934 RepID=UPI00036EE397|nr:FCD domain-containing protein [Elioraea tepidiphila]